jgi:exonuclease SbcC
VRPERLQLEGFTAFRAPVEVDFSGAELFALSGPTGAGKSSLIDAITFALYGTVPRYANQRRIEPVISQGAVEAKVRLDFSVDGVEYTAVRVARLGSRGGASTREARLQRGEEVLAGDADSVSDEVERLLGLSYSHFTTCVVLPQGEFQRFLHDTPRSRQDLLVQLLDLDIYERVAQMARQRASSSEGRLVTIDDQLRELEGATEEQARALQRRSEQIADLASRMEEAAPRITELRQATQTARERADRAAAFAQALCAVTVPEEVLRLDEEMHAAMGALEAAQTAFAEASTHAERIQSEAPERAMRGKLERAIHLHGERTAAAENVARLEDARGELDAAAAKTEGELRDAERAEAEAREAYEQVRSDERAQEFVAALRVGEPCPVCRQVVGEIPDHEHSASVARAEKAGQAAATAAVERRETMDAAIRARQANAAQISTAREALRRMDAQLSDLPGAKEAAAGLQALDATEEKLSQARAAVGERQKELDDARALGQSLISRQSGLRGDLDTARTSLVALEPPATEHESLAADWHRLAEWAEAAAPEQTAAADAARADGERLDSERTHLEKQLASACAALGVATTGGARQAVAAEGARAEVQAAAAREALVRRRRLIEERRRHREMQQVAAMLGTQLSANHFEKWILDEALQRLVEGASEVLHDLSDGTYSLKIDKRGSGFEVVDHTSADATRSVRTLSGGETFLASLALALALADQIAEMAPAGAPRLESMFLDEGFGSLDLETLDTVATALEELGARGRVVGVVSHVRELAERLPTRFEVRKQAGTATIERVDR